ncbi:MAG TPA: hypothetical protein VFL60_05240 [Gaiellaceae bacterium]|nr:hypothetical protein [Gaiellaceae bacterium]
MAPDSVWEIVFLMVILKIPIIYLCSVVWYAIKAEPRPEEGAAVVVRNEPDDGSGPRRRRFGARFPRPHGGPTRTYPRRPQPTLAAARRREES